MEGTNYHIGKLRFHFVTYLALGTDYGDLT